MGKLLNADNINHHKRVNVNKHQRKKQITIVDKLIFKIINVVNAISEYYDDLAARRKMGRCYRFAYDNPYIYQYRSHKIIWDDAAKTSARIMIKTANGYRFIKDKYTNQPKHFSREYLFKYN